MRLSRNLRRSYRKAHAFRGKRVARSKTRQYRALHNKRKGFAYKYF